MHCSSAEVVNHGCHCVAVNKDTLASQSLINNELFSREEEFARQICQYLPDHTCFYLHTQHMKVT
jgi:hypothetical protein